jgi:hypothetical protein
MALVTSLCLVCKNYHGIELKEKHGMTPFIANLAEDDMAMASELFMHVVKIRKQYVMFYMVFFSFIMKYEEKKIHNMSFLMLNPIFKSFRLVSSFIG